MKTIRLSKSIIGQQEVNAVTRILLEDGYLGMGAEVEKFENDIAEYIDVKSENVVCVNSGTAALHLAVEAICNRGDEVLVPSLTFLASYQAISAAGAIPISCEVDYDTMTIDLNDALKRVNKNTKAIMPVHYASNPAHINEIYEFAKKYSLRVIEDAAHAFGCRYNEKKIGSFGDIVCFSFDGIKNITSGEGGALISRDVEVLNLVKDARLLSIQKDSEKRYVGKRSWDFNVTKQGYRYHMSNIFAAIGREQLKRLDKEFAPKRKALFSRYTQGLNNIDSIKLQTIDPKADIIPHIFPIRVQDGKRDVIKNILESNGIQTGIHYKPNHLLTYYKTSYNLPVTEKIYKELISLPLHPEISIEDVDIISSIINKSIENL